MKGGENEGFEEKTCGDFIVILARGPLLSIPGLITPLSSHKSFQSKASLFLSSSFSHE